MSWIGGYKSSKPSTSEADLREEKRKKLEAERALRAKQRVQRQKQLESIAKSREATEKAVQDLLALEPDILAGEDTVVSESEAEILLRIDENSEVDLEAANNQAIMTFETENGEDDATAMDNLRTVQCPFNQEDIEFWFSQLEDQLTLIGVKAQWTKKIALVRFLPPAIQSEVKSLLKLKQNEAGEDIYLKIKNELFGASSKSLKVVSKML